MREKFTQKLDNQFKLNDAVSFVHMQICPFSNFSTGVKFSLSCIRFALLLLRFAYGREALKGYSELYFNIEQDLIKHCWALYRITG